jgi:prephenate dehydrogenase
MREGTLATDAGSIKAAICRDVGPAPAPGVTFIGAHPLAGSERQGFEHASPDLFAGRRCVVTPAGNEHGAAVERIADFWRRLGSDVHFLSPDEHDAVLARTSHVPHVVAAALATLPAERDLLFAATGFRDATRIAAGDPALWAAILRDNRQNVAGSLTQLIERCEEYRTAIESGDSAALVRLLIEAKRRRDAFESLFLNDAP